MSRLATTLASMIERAEREHDRPFYSVHIETGMLRDLIRQDREDPPDGGALAAALRYECEVAVIDHGSILEPRRAEHHAVVRVPVIRDLLDRYDPNAQSVRDRVRREVADEAIRHLLDQADALTRAGLHVRAHEVRHQARLFRNGPDQDRLDPDYAHAAAEVADLIDAANRPALADRIQETT